MEFEWDEAKSARYYEQRGFDFAYVVRAFLDRDRRVRRDHQWDYGEDRYQLLAKIDDRVFHLVYTLRHGRIRIISARKANRKETVDYENHQDET